MLARELASRHITVNAIAQGDTTVSVNGNTRTTVSRYWFNVPKDIQRDAEFQRWQRHSQPL